MPERRRLYEENGMSIVDGLYDKYVYYVGYAVNLSVFMDHAGLCAKVI